MTIELSPELEAKIHEAVKAGAYPSAEAYVAAAIAEYVLPHEQLLTEEAIESLRLACEEADRGELFDPEDVKSELHRRHAAFLNTRTAA